MISSIVCILGILVVFVGIPVLCWAGYRKVTVALKQLSLERNGFCFVTEPRWAHDAIIGRVGNKISIIFASRWQEPKEYIGFFDEAAPKEKRCHMIFLEGDQISNDFHDLPDDVKTDVLRIVKVATGIVSVKDKDKHYPPAPWG